MSCRSQCCRCFRTTIRRGQILFAASVTVARYGRRKVSQSEQPFIRLCLTMKNVFGIVSPRHQIAPREEIYEEDRFRGSCSGCRRLCSASCDRAGWWLSPPSSPSPPPSSLLTKWPLNRGHFFVVQHRPAINWQNASCQYVHLGNAACSSPHPEDAEVDVVAASKDGRGHEALARSRSGRSSRTWSSSPMCRPSLCGRPTRSWGKCWQKSRRSLPRI
jgi:hypothetical protein